MKNLLFILPILILLITCVSCASILDYTAGYYMEQTGTTNPILEWFGTDIEDSTANEVQDTATAYPTYTALPTYTPYPTYTDSSHSANQSDEEDGNEKGPSATVTITKTAMKTPTAYIITRIPPTLCPQYYLNTPCP